MRDAANGYGFAAFTVDPGTRRGGVTSIEVTYCDVVRLGGELAAFESFTLQRPRSDAQHRAASAARTSG